MNQKAETTICNSMMFSSTGSVGTLPTVQIFQIQSPRNATPRVMLRHSTSEIWHARRWSIRATSIAPIPKAADISGHIELLIRFIPCAALREMVRAVLNVTTAIGPIT